MAEGSSVEQEVETDGRAKVVEANHADDDEEEEDENTHDENYDDEDSGHEESEGESGEEKEEEKEKLPTLQSIFKSKKPRSVNLKRLRSLCVVRPVKCVKLAPFIDRNEVDKEENDDDDDDDDDDDSDLLELSPAQKCALKPAAHKQDVLIDSNDSNDNYDDDDNDNGDDDDDDDDDDNDKEKLLEVLPAKKGALKSVSKKSTLKSATRKTIFLIDDDDELDLVDMSLPNKSTTNSATGKHRPLCVSNLSLLERTAASARKDDILIASLFTEEKSRRQS